jgi:hypothetical protein
MLGIFQELWLKCAECQMGFLEQPVMQIVNTTSLLMISDCCGSKLYTELLRILRKLRLKGAMSDVSLEQLALRTLKLTIFANPRTQNHFRSIGVSRSCWMGLERLQLRAKDTNVGQMIFHLLTKVNLSWIHKNPLGFHV